MEKVSRSNIYGKYVNYDLDQEIFVSVKSGVLEIVHRSIEREPQEIHVIKCDLNHLTTYIKFSETVEKSSISDADVYKTIKVRGGPGENSIEILEYRLCEDKSLEHLKIDHGVFLTGLVSYSFVDIGNIQHIKVLRYFFILIGC